MVHLLPQLEKAIVEKEKVELEFPIKNTDRVMGTIIGSEISRKYGEQGLPDNTIHLKFTGRAGQSFGAFIPRGMTMVLTSHSRRLMTSSPALLSWNVSTLYLI